MREQDTPMRLVDLWTERFPSCYKQMDNMHGAKGEGALWWPDYCPLPVSAANTLLMAADLDERTAAAFAAELTACWAWQKDKIIYSFDPDLTDALIEQVNDLNDTDVLPVDLLVHLPYPCIYVKAPTMTDHTDGFFAWIEWDTERKMEELRVQLVVKDFEHTIPQMLHLIPGATIKECIEDTVHLCMKKRPSTAVTSDDFLRTFSTLLAAIQHLLYLTAVNADISDESAPVLTVVKPETSNKKSSEKINRGKENEIISKQVGVRVGAALRAAKKRSPSQNTNAGTGSRKRAHTRRGHWHHYWTGPKDGERELTLKWVSPTMIHPEEGRPDNVTMFPVQ